MALEQAVVDPPVIVQVPRQNRLQKFWATSSTIDNIDSLDGLRAVAALLVLSFHIPDNLLKNRVLQKGIYYSDTGWLKSTEHFWSLGSTGVQLFFVLSGFLLFMPYARALLGLKGFPDTRKFYLRRALRILPAYWTTLFLLVFISIQTFLPLPKPVGNFPDYWTHVSLHVFMLHTWNFNTLTSIYGPFWTMAVESQFYVLLPLMAIILFYFAQRGKRKALWALVALGLGSITLYGFINQFVQEQLPSFRNSMSIFSVFTYLTYFTTGMVGSYWFVATSEGKRRFNFDLYSKKGGLVLRIVAISALLLVVGFRMLQNASILNQEIYHWLVESNLLAILYGSVLLLTLRSRSLSWKVFSWPGLRFIGVVSYSFYIWHSVLLEYVLSPVVEKISFNHTYLAIFWYLVGTVVLIIPFSYLSYMVVERPFMKLRRRNHA